MAKVKALVSFAGLVTMAAGETRDINDKNVVKSLVSAGYVEEVKGTTTKKKGDVNED